MSSNTLTAEKIEERWTPTTIMATFVLPSLSQCQPNSGDISVDLPMPLLGWTFALALTPEQSEDRRKRLSTKVNRLNSGVLTYRRHAKADFWGKTSMYAKFMLFSMDVGNSSLGTMVVDLARTHSLETPLGSRTLSLLLASESKISLDVKISSCPFSSGLFRVASCCANQERGGTWLTKQSGDHLLSQSIATGKISDVTFLTCPATPGNNGNPLETHASLSVLQPHINPSAPLSQGWLNALEALNHHDNTDAKPVAEIPCPEGYEYELDSDFEDDDVAISAPSTSLSGLPDENDSAALEGQSDSDHKIDRSTSSPSLEQDPERVNVPSSLDALPEECSEDPGERPLSSSVTVVDYQRTVLVKFAAHRTWHSFLWYCYTGRVEFSKLKSRAGHDVRHHAVRDGPPSCSPKSMYRLAYLVGDEDLKVKALSAIRTELTETNVVDETFSVFTSKYPDVRGTQLEVLMEKRASPEVKKAFLKTMSKFGEMPHAEPVLAAFYERLAA